MFVTCAGHQGLSVTTAQRRKGGPPKGPPAFSHESTRRNVCRRNTSCSREQHQCRSAGRSCAHTTHSPAAWRCRRSSGSLDHRASPRRSHASASRRRFLAAYSRSFAFAFASARHRSWRTWLPVPSGRARSAALNSTGRVVASGAAALTLGAGWSGIINYKGIYRLRQRVKCHPW